MTDTHDPNDPIPALIFPDEERAMIEDLRPERLVERALVAVWCSRNKRYDLAYHTLVHGPTIAIEAGFDMPGREPAKEPKSGVE